MSEKVLKAVLALVLVVVLWQIVAMRRDLSAERSAVAALTTRIDELQRDLQPDPLSTKLPPLTVTPPPSRAALRRIEQESRERPRPAAGPAEPAAEPDEARWKAQQEAMSQLQTQVQTLLHDVETIGTAVEALGTSVVELRTGAQSIASDVSALGQEITRLNSALERLASESR
jgi:predicted RNase H-like nuclease (RuvC/YqgF family)